jgi:glutamyl-tRNA reductase
MEPTKLRNHFAVAQQHEAMKFMFAFTSSFDKLIDGFEDTPSASGVLRGKERLV